MFKRQQAEMPEEVVFPQDIRKKVDSVIEALDRYPALEYPIFLFSPPYSSRLLESRGQPGLPTHLYR